MLTVWARCRPRYANCFAIAVDVGSWCSRAAVGCLARLAASRTTAGIRTAATCSNTHATCSTSTPSHAEAAPQMTIWIADTLGARHAGKPLWIVWYICQCIPYNVYGCMDGDGDWNGKAEVVHHVACCCLPRSGGLLSEFVVGLPRSRDKDTENDVMFSKRP